MLRRLDPERHGQGTRAARLLRVLRRLETGHGKHSWQLRRYRRAGYSLLLWRLEHLRAGPAAVLVQLAGQTRGHWVVLDGEWVHDPGEVRRCHLLYWSAERLGHAVRAVVCHASV
jgi:hypothetical protein